MRKMMMLVAMVAMFGCVNLSAQKVRVRMERFEVYKRVVVDLSADRSLIEFLSKYSHGFDYVDSVISDKNFRRNDDLKGETKIMIIRFARNTSCEEMIAFAEQEGLDFADAQTLAVLWQEKYLNLPGDNYCVVGINYPEKLFNGWSKRFVLINKPDLKWIESKTTIFKSYYQLVPFIANWGGRKIFEAGTYSDGCRKGDYMVLVDNRTANKLVNK